MLGANHVDSYVKTQQQHPESNDTRPKQPQSVTLATSKWVNDPKHKEVDTGNSHKQKNKNVLFFLRLVKTISKYKYTHKKQKQKQKQKN